MKAEICQSVNERGWQVCQTNVPIWVAAGLACMNCQTYTDIPFLGRGIFASGIQIQVRLPAKSYESCRRFGT